MKTCGLCGHEMTLDRCGSAGVHVDGALMPLCHADDHDCYHGWTVHKVRPPAAPWVRTTITTRAAPWTFREKDNPDAQ